MLSVFPELFFLSPFAALILRVTLGSVLIYCALRHIGVPEYDSRTLGVAEGIVAALLIAGAWTQPAASLAILLIGVWLWFLKFRSVALGTALLSLVIACTLVITGAGPFAFDLPL